MEGLINFIDKNEIYFTNRIDSMTKTFDKNLVKLILSMHYVKQVTEFYICSIMHKSYFNIYYLIQ